MKFLFTTILFTFLFYTHAWAQQWQPVSESSEISFKIKNFGINVNGNFSGVKGDVIFAEEDLPAARFDISIPANTINTGINQRDNHLRKEEYLDAEKYPELHFISTQVTASTDKEYHFVFGKLTIKDVTKEVSFPFKATKTDTGYIFEGTVTLNRRDYNVGGSSISMSDELTVTLKLLVKKKE